MIKFSLSLDIEGAEAGVNSAGAQLFLNAEQLVILCHTLAAAGSTGLDLAGVQCNSQVCNGGVLGLAGTVRSNSSETCLVSHLDRFQSLGAYALSTTDPEEQGVIFHLKPGWSCTAAQYENRLTLQFAWEAPEKPAATGYVLSSPAMEPGTELAELTESLLWEGATQLQLTPRDYRVVLGEFSTPELAEKGRETILKTKNIPLDVLPIFPENP